MNSTETQLESNQRDVHSQVNATLAKCSSSSLHSGKTAQSSVQRTHLLRLFIEDQPFTPPPGGSTFYPSSERITNASPFMPTPRGTNTRHLLCLLDMVTQASFFYTYSSRITHASTFLPALIESYMRHLLRFLREDKTREDVRKV